MADIGALRHQVIILTMVSMVVFSAGVFQAKDGTIQQVDTRSDDIQLVDIYPFNGSVVDTLLPMISAGAENGNFTDPGNTVTIRLDGDILFPSHIDPTHH